MDPIFKKPWSFHYNLPPSQDWMDPLPNELIQLILKYLNQPALASTALVSRRWSQIVKPLLNSLEKKKLLQLHQIDAKHLIPLRLGDQNQTEGQQNWQLLSLQEIIAQVKTTIINKRSIYREEDVEACRVFANRVDVKTIVKALEVLNNNPKALSLKFLDFESLVNLAIESGYIHLTAKLLQITAVSHPYNRLSDETWKKLTAFTLQEREFGKAIAIIDAHCAWPLKFKLFSSMIDAFIVDKAPESIQILFSISSKDPDLVLQLVNYYLIQLAKAKEVGQLEVEMKALVEQGSWVQAYDEVVKILMKEKEFEWITHLLKSLVVNEAIEEKQSSILDHLYYVATDTALEIQDLACAETFAKKIIGSPTRYVAFEKIALKYSSQDWKQVKQLAKYIDEPDDRLELLAVVLAHHNQFEKVIKYISSVKDSDNRLFYYQSLAIKAAEHGNVQAVKELVAHFCNHNFIPRTFQAIVSAFAERQDWKLAEQYTKCLSNEDQDSTWENLVLIALGKKDIKQAVNFLSFISSSRKAWAESMIQNELFKQ